MTDFIFELNKSNYSLTFSELFSNKILQFSPFPRLPFLPPDIKYQINQIF